MEIKVKKVTGSETKTTSEIQLTTHLKASPEIKSKIKRDVGEFLVERIISSAGQSKSPIQGEDWPALSENYRKKKKAEGLPGKANLELEGDLLDNLTFEETPSGIELGWFGDQAGKADGHNNFSGKSDLPRRRVLPGKGQQFVESIQGEVEKIVSDIMSDSLEFDKGDFESVDTKADLYSTLLEYFPDMSKVEIRSLVSRTPKLAGLLEDMDLLKLL